MKKNDIVLDKNQGIGIITKIENQKIFVQFNSLNKIVYNINNTLLTIIDNEFISYINSIYRESLINNKKTIDEIERSLFSEFSYVNGCFSCNINETPKVRTFIDSNSLHNLKCTCKIGGHCIHTDMLLGYIKESLDYFKGNFGEEDIEQDSLNKLTKDLINNFCDLLLFNQLCNEIRKATVNQLCQYLIYIYELEKNSFYAKFFILLVTNNTSKIVEIDEYFTKTKYMDIKYTLSWFLYRKNYTKDINYLLNNAIVCFKENRFIDFVESVFNTGNVTKIIEADKIFNKLFKTVVKNISSIDPLLEIVNQTKLYDYELKLYFSQIFISTTNENKKMMVFEKRLLPITMEMVSFFDLKDIINNYELVDKDIKYSFLNKYIEDIIKINPDIALNMIISPDEKITNYEWKQMSNLVDVLPNNVFLKEYIQNIMYIPKADSIDTIMKKCEDKTKGK